MTKRKQKRNPKSLAPAGRGPGPATNRRKANQPIAPAKGRKFLERCAVDDPGPDDLTHFDAAPDDFDQRTGGTDEK